MFLVGGYATRGIYCPRGRDKSPNQILVPVNRTNRENYIDAVNLADSEWPEGSPRHKKALKIIEREWGDRSRFDKRAITEMVWPFPGMPEPYC